ncbi:MAG: hypothetical protein IJR47_01185 [Clostridia bacterium]|nr:hypothetical protein [Clostridia bacterium]
MSKYKGLPSPKAEEKAEQKKAAPTPVSKLCCLPILLEGQKSYQQQMDKMLMFKELLPKEHRIGIYQMMYMSKLLEQIRNTPYEEDEDVNPFEFVSKMDESGTAEMFEKILRHQNGEDMSFLLSILEQQNPMLSLLLPMLQGGGGDFSSLLPFLMGNMGI